MTKADWKSDGQAAQVVQALLSHRLIPVATLLAERGLLRGDIVPVASRLGERLAADGTRRNSLETRVVDALVADGVVLIVLKGALLARTVYSNPEARIRTDIDLLVAPDSVSAASASLRRMGFVPGHEIHGGAPMTQEQWIRPEDDPVHAVDLHWDLFNLPLLKSKFRFSSLLARAKPVPGLAGQALGLSGPDALVHSCTHYFGHHQGEFRPDQWLLDIDLLWRSMSWEDREQVASLASAVGAASLVARGLELAADRFLTPVEPDLLQALWASGSGEKARRLLRPPRWRVIELVRSGLEEQGYRVKLVHLFRLAFPPVAYMHRKYPGYSRWALPWLYVKRMVGGARRRF